MLDQVLNLFGIAPDFDLNLMQPDQDLTHVTSKVLHGLRGVMQEWRPDWLVVQGDTTTTFASSLAAFFEQVGVAHVEAGLRTGNIKAPWPEEANRRLTSVIASRHFAPTARARTNLLSEGVPGPQIWVTGNTVVDALVETERRIATDDGLRRKLEEHFSFLDERPLILVTGHRRESFGPRLESVCTALRRLAARGDTQVLYPVHLNPNVQEPVRRILGGVPDVWIVDPLDYLPFVHLMRRSYLIISDSGGIQEEAPSLGKPVLVTREVTERPEALEAGTAKLVGTNADKIVSSAEELLDDPQAYKSMTRIKSPYGDGRAGRRIAEVLTADI
jgi:UDP-N-acetylglucosamine 2-epimerase (non-hydrolysing)